MSRFLAPLLYVGLGFALAVLVGRMTADVALAKAEAWEMVADTALADRDAALARADSAALIAVSVRAKNEADSARWDTERRSLRALVASETAHHGALADSVRARVDSATAVLVTSMEAAHVASLTAAREETARADSSATGLRIEVGELAAQIVELRDALGSAEVANALYRQANAGLQRALRSQHVVGEVTKWTAVAGSGKVCYDAINEGQTGLAIGSCAVATAVGLIG